MHQLENQKLSIGIKVAGAELQSIKTHDGLEYIWQADPKYWGRHSPVLFPMVGAMPGGHLEQDGQRFPMGNHGFARDRDFTLAAKTSDSLLFRLEDDEFTHAIFPSSFVLEIGYQLRDTSVRVTYRVGNPDSEHDLHFGIGAHPAFRAPLLQGETRDDYQLVFEHEESTQRQLINKEGLRTGQTKPFKTKDGMLAVKESLFDPCAIILTEHRSRQVSLQHRKTGKGVKVSFPQAPYLGIWAPLGNAPFVCLEPWWGITAKADDSCAWHGREGHQKLVPGASFEAWWEIEVLV